MKFQILSEKKRERKEEKEENCAVCLKIPLKIIFLLNFLGLRMLRAFLGLSAKIFLLLYLFYFSRAISWTNQGLKFNSDRGKWKRKKGSEN